LMSGVRYIVWIALTAPQIYSTELFVINAQKALILAIKLTEVSA